MMAHELGHACGLTQGLGVNLMNPDRDEDVAYALSKTPAAWNRNSRFIVYSKNRT